MTIHAKHLTGKLVRSAAVLGIATIGSLSAAMIGTAATAPAAGAIPNCPPILPHCVLTTPSTRPPVVDPGTVGPGVLDPNAGDPPVTTPPTTPPTTPTNPTNGGTTNTPPRTNTGGNGGSGAQTQTNATPTPTVDANTATETNAAATDSKPDDGGSSVAIIAIVGGIAALGAAGTGLYLRYGRRA